MTDYYNILEVSKDSSSLKIFKEFRRQCLRQANSKLETEEVLKAYLVLQYDSKKFYDIVLKQQRNNKTINPKYLAVIRNKERQAKELFDKQKDNPGILTKPLVKYPLSDSGVEFIGLLMEVNIGWVATGFLLTLAAILMTGFFLSKGDWMILLISIPLTAIGIIMHNHGVMKFRKQKMEKITAH